MIDMYCWIGFLAAFPVVISSPSLPELRHTNESDFNVVVQMPTFIDKTLFVKYVHQKGTANVHLAPRGFGKSTNLDMVRKFFQAEVTQDGDILTQQMMQYYRLFKGLNIWKHEGSFMKKHFGRYPVLWIDLKLVSTDHSREDTLKNITQEMFMDHSYLSNSKQLSEPHKMSFEKKYVAVLDPKVPFDPNDVTFLVRLLAEHYGRHVIVLVDDIDAPAMAGVGGAGNSEKQDESLQTLGKYLRGILKDNQFVFYSLSTGTTRACYTIAAYVNNLNYVSIFDNENIAKFYGFTLDDVQEKANDLERAFLAKGIKETYNGHTVENSKMTVYNTQSIVKSLSTGSL